MHANTDQSAGVSASADAGRLTVTYRLSGDREHAVNLAREIAFEQTVELPQAQVPADIRERIVGRVEDCLPDPGQDGASLAVISYDAALAGGQLSQLLNLLFGNASIFPGVRVVTLELPESVTARLSGPRHGVDGLRGLLGVYGRPLLATALKPKGATHEELAELARGFALGGGDLVKDDQNLADDFETFKQRVEACRRAVEDANERTGRRTLYLPHLTAPAAELERYLDFVALSGLQGVLVCPMILGLETTRFIGERYPLLVMAHPALSGSYTHSDIQGIDHGLLLGTLFRLAGADISIFPNVGGRFSFSREQCLSICERLRAPLGALAPAWPAPGGGMRLDRIDDMCADYGADTVFLVGGALHAEGDHITSGTRAFLDAIRARFEESLKPPADHLQEGGGDEVADAQFFPFEQGFRWRDRESTPYKDAGDLAFKGVRRVELIGKFGERTSCDLRYFEVEPGGHTSREKHLHTHIVIGARGEATLSLGNRRMPFRQHDVAYIRPLEVHQFVNEGEEPFGFYCVVDHVRDRPMKP
ncbi:MAG: RuBisCO large subunit C-terminal-like domain-containing protein [Gammaproteobacteria bacterium]|nr:RuBisCO large subunit C-terminal-like domain-containing protein [Gammaproteobacteria bacterium]